MDGSSKAREPARTALTTQRIRIEAALHDEWHANEDEPIAVSLGHDPLTYVTQLWEEHAPYDVHELHGPSWAIQTKHHGRVDDATRTGILRELAASMASHATDALFVVARQQLAHSLQSPSLQAQVNGHDIAIAKLKRDLEALTEVVVATRQENEGALHALDVLAQDFAIREPGMVARHFTKRRSDLAETLRLTSIELRRRIHGASFELTPTDDGRLLFVAKLPFEANTRDAINAFRREWWIERFTGEDGVTLDLEFV